MKVSKKKFKNIAYVVLIYYSLGLSTLLFIGGIYTSGFGEGFMANLLFLPVVVFLWITFLQRKKAIKTGTKNK